VPIAVIDRPSQSFRALAAPAAQALARYRIPENEARQLATCRPPAWVFLTGMKINLSSTGLRNPDGSWKLAGAAESKEGTGILKPLPPHE